MSDDLIWARPSGPGTSPAETPTAVRRDSSADSVWAAPGAPPVAVPSARGTTEADAVIRASSVTRTFTRGSEVVKALDEVDLELVRGEIVALVGRSGSGKTTLLNVLCGWESADAGVVTWLDGTVGVSDVPWSGIALIPQSPGLLEDLSVAENVALPRRLRGDTTGRASRQSDAEEVMTMLDSLDLEHLADRYPDEMSLGEQQRAAVARALLLGPDLLLADEPTAHQDEASMARVLSAVRAVVDSGGASLVASHSPEVLEAADRVVEIDDGKLTLRS